MRHLAVFARWPVAGAVKTRLHSVLGAELAARLHTGMLHDALDTAAAARSDRAFVYWADRPGNTEPFAVPTGITARDQRGSDLGARLEAAFDELLANAGDHAVVIGADCPELTADIVDQAFAELERSDLVIAPAEDGGYSLIGLSRPSPELFRDVPWGTEAVLSATLARAESSQHRAVLLARTHDLDRASDLVAFLGRAARNDTSTPHTRAVLREIKLLP